MCDFLGSDHMPQHWTALTVVADARLGDAIGSFLLDHGAPGLEIEDTAEGTRITAHYGAEPPVAALRAYCRHVADAFPGAAPPRISATAVSDEAWAENWKDHFPPLAVGERLYVHAPWVDRVPPDRLPIMLEPGMAFGTGHHASTRGCLELLETALASRVGGRVLDIGTGSGILAIAAIKLGAASAWAVDVDAEACAIAEQNAIANGVGGAIRFGADLGAATGPFEVVLANLFAGQLIAYAAEIASRLAPGGVAIGAGILAAEAESVRTAWRAAGLTGARAWSDEGWVTLAFRRAP